LINKLTEDLPDFARETALPTEECPFFTEDGANGALSESIVSDVEVWETIRRDMMILNIPIGHILITEGD